MNDPQVGRFGCHNLFFGVFHIYHLPFNIEDVRRSLQN
jgi:hypothetical protein